jgi:hypothetical protein
MKDKQKIELILEILERYEEGTCFYCGSTLNGDYEFEDRDEGYSDYWCPNCCKDIVSNDDWEKACLDAIDKVIHDQKFES